MQETDPRVVEHYDDLAPYWADITDVPERANALWPAVETMLPDVGGRRVLDAGCGSGVYAAKLADAGAEVVGVDLSESMLAEARERVPDATFHRADVRTLELLAEGSVDVVLCQHVVSHLPDLSEPLAAFGRVLVDGGVLVLSTHNPVHDYVVVRDREYPTTERQDGLDPTVETDGDTPTYADTERFDVEWAQEAVAQRGTYYRRSVEALVSPLLDAGFTLQEIAEPTGDERTAQSERESWADEESENDPFPPKSICLRAVRRSPAR